MITFPIARKGVFVGLLALQALSATAQPGVFPPIDALANAYVKKPRQHALEVGILFNGKHYFMGYGQLSRTRREAPTASTLFEIGAVSGVFTGTLLSVLEDKGSIRPDATIQRTLPAGFRGPVYVPLRYVAVTPPADSSNPRPEPVVTCLPDPIAGEQEIALCQLAYHAAGLTCSCANLYRWHPMARPLLSPNMPGDLPDATSFLQEAAHFECAAAPGSQFVFSNIGMAYLGHLLASHQGLSYESLLAREITQPVGMPDTRVHLLPVQQSRLAPGHDKSGKPAPNWDFQGMAPAAGIKSTAHDLLRFLSAQLQAVPGISWNAALQARQGVIEARFPGWKYPTQAAYGWLVSTTHANHPIAWMNGGTGGYRTFLALEPHRRIGIVLLANSSGDLTELGFQMLDILFERSE